MKVFIKLFISLLIVFGAAAAGHYIVKPAMAGWLASTTLPSYGPPDWFFGAAWTLLYLLMALSLWFAWCHHAGGIGYLLFAVQLAINLFWLLLFFWAHAYWSALAMNILYLIVVAATMRIFWRVSRSASLLLLPLLLFLPYTIYLNFVIARLN